MDFFERLHLRHHLDSLRLKSQNFRTVHFGDVFSREAFIIIFVISFGLGIGVKSLLNDVLTIGFEDYKLKGSENALDLNRVEKNVIAKADNTEEKNPVPYGEVCPE